jgi:hypothetical protein
MAQFPNVERAKMYFIHGFCDGNAKAAMRKYQDQYPDRRQSNRYVFTTVHSSLKNKQVHSFHQHQLAVADLM